MLGHGKGKGGEEQGRGGEGRLEGSCRVLVRLEQSGPVAEQQMEMGFIQRLREANQGQHPASPWKERTEIGPSEGALYPRGSLRVFSLSTQSSALLVHVLNICI